MSSLRLISLIVTHVLSLLLLQQRQKKKFYAAGVSNCYQLIYILQNILAPVWPAIKWSVASTLFSLKDHDIDTNIVTLVGFACVRALTLCTPVLLGSLSREMGRCAPSTPLIAALPSGEINDI
jgi:hypothetical protein